MNSPKINLETDYFYYDEKGNKIKIELSDINLKYCSDSSSDDNLSEDVNEDDNKNFFIKLWDLISNFFDQF